MNKPEKKSSIWTPVIASMFLGVSACGGSLETTGSDPIVAPPGSPPIGPPPPPPPPPPPGGQESPFATKISTSHFLTQATFGPTPQQISALTGTNVSDWLLGEFQKSPSYNLDYVINFTNKPENRDNGHISYIGLQAPSYSFWSNAIDGNDQLRQRTAFALSQILVISHNKEGSTLYKYPTTVAHYQDILTRNAFGNYRDLLEEVTYSPAMGVYLTYWKNQKADPQSGRMPDENYARELMQLFTIGLEDLNPDGTPKGQETYTLEDVAGLARVFTGLSLNSDGFFRHIGNVNAQARYSPMKIFPKHHSSLEKKFLGTTIPAGTSAEESIDTALDTLFEHPNVGPFVGRQLIQRFVTSNPEPAYVARVSAAFDAGSFTLPNGTKVGEGRRGDLKATISAVLLDPAARNQSNRDANTYGKVREPILRFTHWTRAFDAGRVAPRDRRDLLDVSGPNALAQHPFQAPSVFNFYRPGYLAPGTKSGAAGVTAPELQLVNASSSAGYANFISDFITIDPYRKNKAEKRSFIPDYTDELAMASKPDALLDHLDLILTYGSMSAETRASILKVIESVPLTNENDKNYDGPFTRVSMAVVMIMTSPDYLVQR